MTTSTGGNPVNVHVQVEFRPVTQHGMRGMRAPPGQQGPGRQLADSSFFAAELRNKITEIADEIARLEAEIEARTQGQAATAHLARQYDDVARAVEALEGQLADCNLAHDKIRSGTDVRDLTDRVQRLQASIDQQKHGIDELFSGRAALDAQRARLEDEIGAMLQDEERLVNGATDAVRQQYATLRQEALEAHADLVRKDEHLAGLRQKAAEQSAVLGRDEFRAHLRGLQLQKERLELDERARDLRDDCDPNRTVDQMRERLQVRAKEDGILVRTLEERRAALVADIARLQEALQERELQKQNASEFDDLRRKYEALYQRDKAMQEFLDRFAATRDQDAGQKRAVQGRIVTLLEHISEGILRKENLPSPGQVQAMQSDLSFKSKELDASVATLDRVRKELDKRRAELDQVSGLADKIRAELGELRARAAQMQADAVVLADVEGLKARETGAQLALQQDLETVKHKRAALQVQVQNLSRTYEARKKALADDEDWKRLQSLEAKLRTYSQTAYQLESHVAGRRREGDYEMVRDQVEGLVQQLNALTVGRH